MKKLFLSISALCLFVCVQAQSHHNPPPSQTRNQAHSERKEERRAARDRKHRGEMAKSGMDKQNAAGKKPRHIFGRRKKAKAR